MRHLIILLILLCGPMTAVPENANLLSKSTYGKDNRLELQLILLEENPVAGDAIWVDLVMRNASKQPVSYIAVRELNGFELSLYYVTKEKVPATEFGRRIAMRPDKTSSVSITLQPGQTNSYHVNIQGRRIKKLRGVFTADQLGKICLVLLKSMSK